MPNDYDFSKLENVQARRVEPEGWITPLYVEYGTGLHGGIPSYFWKVKGTSHTFVIPILRMDFLSKGEYEAHFKEVLEGFREDYIEWNSKGWNSEWMQEYREQYRDFISL